MKYLKNILISIDQLVNTIFGGDPDETISSRLGKNYKGTWLERFVDWLFKWQNNPEGHCEGSIEQDEGKDSIISIKKDKTNLS